MNKATSSLSVGQWMLHSLRRETQWSWEMVSAGKEN